MLVAKPRKKPFAFKPTIRVERAWNGYSWALLLPKSNGIVGKSFAGNVRAVPLAEAVAVYTRWLQNLGYVQVPEER